MALERDSQGRKFDRVQVTGNVVGQTVTYAGSTYACLQAHTSQAGWHPDAVPNLWQPQ